MAVRVCGVASRSGAGKVIRGGPGPVGDLEGEEPGTVEVTTLKGGTWGSSSRRETLLGQTVAVRERRVVRANGEAAGGVELGTHRRTASGAGDTEVRKEIPWGLQS